MRLSCTIFATLLIASTLTCPKISAQTQDEALAGADEKQAIVAIVQSAPAGWQTVAVSPESFFNNSEEANRLLKEYHLKGSAQTAFQRGQRKVTARVYHFRDSDSAYGAYSVIRQGATTVVARGDAASEDDDNITFVKGSYLFVLETSAQEDEEAKELMRTLAGQFENALSQTASRPKVISTLPQIDLIKGSEKLFMGPAAAKRFLTIPYISFLKIDQGQAATADYQFQSPTKERLKLLLIAFTDPKLALQAYQDYVGNLMGSHSCQNTATTAMFKMDPNYLFCQIKGNNLLVVSGARKSVSALMLAKQVR